MKPDLYVYWCPICEFQCSRNYHTIDDGGLIPQNAIEHECDRVPVIRSSIAERVVALANLYSADFKNTPAGAKFSILASNLDTAINPHPEGPGEFV